MSDQTSPVSNSTLHWDLEYPQLRPATDIYTKFILSDIEGS